MKHFPTLIVLFINFVTVSVHACQNGDTSKTLLVVRETRAGHENLAIGEINNQDGKVTSDINNFYVLKTGPSIIMKDFSGDTYTFERARAAFDGDKFCFPVIYAD